MQSLLFVNENSCVPPMTEKQVRKIAASAIRLRTKDQKIQDRPEYRVLGTLLADHYEGGEHIRHVQGHGFLVYDTTKWVLTDSRLIEQQALAIVEALTIPNGGKALALVSDVMRLLEVKHTVKRDVFFGDVHQHQIINCANGEIWVDAEGKASLRQHSPNSNLTHCLSVAFDPDAKSPMYDKALLQIFQKAQDPKDLARHWNELCGYIIQSKRDVAVVALLLGDGANGKSELWQTVSALIGEQFVFSGSIDQLESNRFAIGSLRGKLLLVDDDMRSGAKLPDGMLKKLSEGKPLTGELKGKDAFSFFNRAVPMLLANNEPSTSDLSYGMARRVQVFPCNYRFDEDEIDKSLWPAIRDTELSGILNRYLNGLRRLRKRGSKWKLPVDVKAAQQDWFRHANPLKGFLDECCEPGPGKTSVRQLFEAYGRWGQENGINFRLQRNNFSRKLEQLGYNVGRTKTGRVVLGLHIKDDTQ